MVIQEDGMSNADAPHHARFRFRCESLKMAEKANAVRDSLSKTKGVVKVAVNKRVGSLLVCYDQTKAKVEQLFQNVASSLGIDVNEVKRKLSSVNRAIVGRTSRRIVKRGMLGAGIATLALLAYSEKKHAISGSIWVGLMAVHLYQNKRTLFS